jgi:23S rRNA pseudouridine1911/1915/1917 synthase
MAKNIQICLLKSCENSDELLKNLFSLSGQKLKAFRKKHPKELSWCKKPKLNERDVLTIPLDMANHLLVHPVYDGPMIPVLFEDDAVIVFDKPSGIHGHPLHYEDQQNLLSFMRENNWGAYLDPYPVEVGPERGLLYRLDKGTSGVLVYIKDPQLHFECRQHFLSLCRRKTYHCWVHVQDPKALPFQEEKWVDYLKGSGPKGAQMKMAPEGAQGALRAELRVRVLQWEKGDPVALLEVNLETGLRHQIRVQLANRGMPIVGDELYHGPKASRLFLQAQCYEFEISGRRYGFQSQRSFNLVESI